MASYLDLGVPANLPVKARRGSSIRIQAIAPDGTDLTTVTSVTCVLKPNPGGDNSPVVLTLTGDLTNKADGVIVLTASAAASAATPAGRYVWELQLNATDALDGRAISTGFWEHVERWAWPTR